MSKQRERFDSNTIAELDRHFTPKGSVGSKLPNPKDIKDLSEAFTKNSDGTYNYYKMIQGGWLLIAENLEKV